MIPVQIALLRMGRFVSRTIVNMTNVPHPDSVFMDKSVLKIPSGNVFVSLIFVVLCNKFMLAEK